MNEADANPDETGFRLSSQQVRLFADRTDAVPRLSATIRLATQPDADALARRWADCVADLEILRTVCVAPAWSRLPLQVVHDTVDARVAVDRVAEPPRPPSPGDPSLRLADPTEAPPVAVRLLLDGEAAWLQISGAAHAVDGDSLCLLAERLLGSDTDEAPLQYPDIAEWSAGLADDPDAAPGLAHWRGVADSTRDLAAPLGWSGGPGTVWRSVDAPWPKAWADGSPTPAQALAVAQIFAARCADSDRTAVAWRSDGRDLEELSGAIGPLARWLPIVSQKRLNDPYRAWWTAAEAAIDQATDWQHLLEAGIGGDGPPPVVVGVHLMSGPLPGHLSGEAPTTVDWLDPEPGAPPMILRIDPASRRMTLLADPALADTRQATLLARLAATLAEAAEDDPDRPVHRLDWLDGETTATLLALGTGPDLPEPDRLPAAIARQVGTRAEHPAVVQGERTLSYEALWARAGSVASTVPAPRGDADRPVAIRLPRGPDAVAAMLGAWRAGRPYLPCDPALPQARIDAMLAVADPIVTVTGIQDEPADTPVPADSGDLAYLLFTSGSTGTPKGIDVTHAALAATTAARSRHYGADPDRFLLVSPLGFDSSVAGLHWTLATGGTVHLPTDAEAGDAGALARLIRERAITHTLMLPGLYDAVLDAAAPGDLESLTLVIVAGEACPAPLVERHRACLPRTRLENEYGPTEATVWCTAARLDTAPDGEVTIGKAIPGAVVRVVDRWLRPVPPGVPGTICVGGAGVARGYRGRPGETAARFVPDPFALDGGRRLFLVGDRGTLTADGRIRYQGRADNQVKLRGYRVELEEIEGHLQAAPAIREAAVAIRNGRLTAYLVPREGTAVPEAARTGLCAGLPDWMTPQAWVTLTALPRGATGKLDRAALPEVDADIASDGYRSPRDATETAVARIWAELLTLDRVGIDDDFFRLGGDSLVALRAATRMRQIGLDASPRLLLKHPTIATLTAAAPRIAPPEPEAPSRPALAPTEPVPVTPVQAWLIGRADGIPARYNQTLRVRAREALDLARLEQAFAAVVARHEALRLRFEHSPDGWRQVPSPAEIDPPLLYDLSRVPEPAHAAIEAGAWETLHAGLDPANGRHARLALIRRGEAAGDLLLAVVHHLAIDAASWRIVMADLETAYRALGEADDVIWPDEAGSFATWAAAVRRLPAVRLSADFWRDRTAADIRALPCDRPGAPNSEGDVATLSVALDPETTDLLARRAPSAFGSGLDAVLTVCLAETLAAWSGNSVIRIDRERHGRNDDLVGMSSDRTVGWFTTVHPVVLHLPEGDPAAARRAVLDQIAAVPDEGFGYGLLGPSAPDGEVLFNFLGRTDLITPEGALFAVAPGPVGRTRAPDLRRPCLLEIDGEIADGCLRFHWTYSDALHDAETIDRIARDHLDRIAAIAGELETE